jgi:hypothetical protein
VGPTIKAILVKQFTALRDGDRFFYLNESFTSEAARSLSRTDSLAEVIQANSDITNLQSDVFFVKESISGTVFSDADHAGLPRAGNNAGVPGINVNLNDSSGNVVATTTTDSHGHYSFTDQTGIPGTGKFNVTIVLPPGSIQTTPNPPTISLSRGGLHVDHVDFGIDSRPLGDWGHVQPDSTLIGYGGESGPAPQTVLVVPSAGEPIVQSGMGETMTDVVRGSVDVLHTKIKHNHTSASDDDVLGSLSSDR